MSDPRIERFDSGWKQFAAAAKNAAEVCEKAARSLEAMLKRLAAARNTDQASD